VDPAKVKEIVAWSIPTTVTDIRSFLGLVGYYQRFIEGFSNIAKPMTSLMEKGRDWYGFHYWIASHPERI
jgi:hypothetical protein